MFLLVAGVTIAGFGAFLCWWSTLNDSPASPSSTRTRVRFVALHPVMATVVLYFASVGTARLLRGTPGPVQIVALFLLFWLEVAAAAWATTIIRRLRPVLLGQFALLAFAWFVPAAAYAVFIGFFVARSPSGEIGGIPGSALLVGGVVLLLAAVGLEARARQHV